MRLQVEHTVNPARLPHIDGMTPGKARSMADPVGALTALIVAARHLVLLQLNFELGVQWPALCLQLKTAPRAIVTWTRMIVPPSRALARIDETKATATCQSRMNVVHELWVDCKPAQTTFKLVDPSHSGLPLS
jgi:hypothetical protein